MFELAEQLRVPVMTAVTRILAEPGVTDLVCNGVTSAWVLRGGVWLAVEPPIKSEFELEELARALIAGGGKRLDLASPMASALLSERVRVHAVLASAVSSQTLLSFRVLADREFGLQQLVALGAIDEFTRSRLVALMRGGASLLISGASGAGKTSLLRALLAEVESTRVITIEDVPELRLGSKSFVSLISRAANVEGRGEISLDALLVEALRMRADRIVIGEVRSAELLTLLQAANSGHPVAATLHANSATQVMQRLVAIGAANSISADAVRQMAATAIDAYLHIAVGAGGRRTIHLQEVPRG